ncbi:cytochrome c maturation protein CcmE [Thioalkalivibrio thiocyanodenitrificans]|uniref:cytochrome c maturation protein CcmE n=1 Tax=Thioalkalivibrio thiocyanodenitrificans TaxID=243063 RepID=UPI00036879F4|nr:cytochrome c maturation protein CcmE [Thioalkalivibrio thiocyanodenitrificans]
MTKRQKRLALVAGVLAGLAIATALILNAFRDSMVFFVTPSEVMAMTELPERKFRIGGLVESGSVVRDQQSVQVSFRVTDTAMSVPVTFEGILPALFREGQGVVAEGRIDADGTFHADKVLARHDEEYMPAEAQAAIERAGHPPGAGKEY